MTDKLFTVVDDPGTPAVHEYDQRRSRFLARVSHVDDAVGVTRAVESARRGNPKARHVVHASILGSDPGSLDVRMGDDGEPSGTAARPMLDILRARHLTDCVVVVTRYFGGVLLGAGGLVRAYSAAASEALDAARLAALVECWAYSIVADYASFAVVETVAARSSARILRVDYGERVECEIAVPCGESSGFELGIRERTAGYVQPERRGVVRIAVPIRA